MDIDDDSEDGKGCDEAGLPTKWQVQSHCEDCGAEITDDNKLTFCSGCGISGCQTCLKECNDVYLCRDKYDKKMYKQKCLDLIYAEFKGVLDDVVDKLHKFINGEDKK